MSLRGLRRPATCSKFSRANNLRRVQDAGISRRRWRNRFIGLESRSGDLDLCHISRRIYHFADVCLGPIAKALDERAEKIHSDMDRAEAIRKEAEEKLQDYMKKLDGLREEGQEIVTEARSDSERLKNEILDEARKEAESIKNRALRDLGLARDRALDDLHKQVAELSVSIAGQILGRSLSPQDHSELIEKSLKQLQSKN